MHKRNRKRPSIVRRVVAAKRRNLADDDDPLFEERELEFFGCGDDRLEPTK